MARNKLAIIDRSSEALAAWRAAIRSVPLSQSNRIPGSTRFNHHYYVFHRFNSRVASVYRDTIHIDRLCTHKEVSDAELGLQ